MTLSITFAFLIMTSITLLLVYRNYSRKIKNKKFKNAIPYEDLRVGNINFYAIEFDENGTKYLDVSYKETPNDRFFVQQPKDLSIRNSLINMTTQLI